MSKQPNSLFKAAWKWPLLKQQLIELNQQLQSLIESIPQHQLKSKQLLQVADSYQQVYRKLSSIGLMDFAELTEILIFGLEQIAKQEQDRDYLIELTKASEVMQQQFLSLVETASYQQQLLVDCITKLQPLIARTESGNNLFDPRKQRNASTRSETDDNDSVVISLAQRSLPSVALEDTVEPSVVDNKNDKQEVNKPVLDDSFNNDYFEKDQIEEAAEAESDLEPVEFDKADLNETDLNETELAETETEDEIKEVVSNKDSSRSILQSVMQQVNLTADDEECDEEIKEIFIEEANEVLEIVSSQFSKLSSLDDDPEQLSEIRRSFHTLKGSGRMAGANTTADLAAATEMMLNRVLEGSIQATAGMHQLLGDIIDHYPKLIEQFKQNASYPELIKMWIAAAQLYAKNQHSDFVYSEPTNHDLIDSGHEQSQEQLTQEQLTQEPHTHKQLHQEQQSLREPSVLNDPEVKLEAKASSNSEITLTSATQNQPETDSETQLKSSSETQEASHCEADQDDQLEDEELKQLFISEAQELIDSIEVMLSEFTSQQPAMVTDNLIRAFHTLRGAASSQSVTKISDLSGKVEHNLQRLQQQGEPLSATQLQAMSYAAQLAKHYLQEYTVGALSQQSHNDIEQLKTLIESTSKHRKNAEVIADSDKVSQSDEAVSESHDNNDYRVAELIEGIDDLLDAEWELDKLFNFEGKLTDEQQTEVREYAAKLLLQCQKLAAKVTRSQPFNLLLAALQQAYHSISKRPQLMQSSDNVKALIAGHEQITGLFDSLAGKMALRVDETVIEKLNALKDSLESIEEEEDKKDPSTIEKIDTEADLLAIFSEEAQELDESCHQQLILWQQQPQNIEPVKVLQRHLHTLKGGALMAGIESIAELSHEAETLYEYFTGKLITPTSEWVALMQSVQDVLSEQIERLATQQQPFFASQMVQQLRLLARTKTLTEGEQQQEIEDNSQQHSEAVIIDSAIGDEEVLSDDNDTAINETVIEVIENKDSDDTDTDTESSSKLSAAIIDEDLVKLDLGLGLESEPVSESNDNALQLLEEQIELPDISEIPPWLGETLQSEETSGSTEMIRVPSKLMEQMIDLSGETVINRSRIELSMKGVDHSLEEMERTVQRLSEQLRRMDIELEAQIRSQIDDKYLQHSHSFDPLEMDQYSALNQLSKSLAESASDLLEIKTTLKNNTQGTETLLMQLSQAQSQLQQGLMTSRMVSFSRIIPRLQRIVRLTANELDKQVSLEVVTEHDEIDRTVLERLTAPLEHMLRNAVDHGIESPEQRQSLGKSGEGKILVEVAREGSEIVIQIKDDGQGIDVESVRHKAISQGLIEAEEATTSDLEVMQYIFHAGLTTANEVTQISGRGVGMDVVLSEVRQLGGSVNVQSEPGKGSQFNLKLPLTIAVAEVLVVRAADQTFAIPLLQIERVERVETSRLMNFYYPTDSEQYQSEDTVGNKDNSLDKSLNNNLDKHSAKKEVLFSLADRNYRLRHLAQVLGGQVPSPKLLQSRASSPVLLLKDQVGQNLAIQVDSILGSRTEVVVKPLGDMLSSVPGLSAATITAEGSVMFILDTLVLMREAALKEAALKEAILNKTPISGPPAPQTTEQQLALSGNTGDISLSKPSGFNARKQILIVDDSVTVRKVTSRMMQRHGYETHVARDGVEAVEILQTLRPDLMLLDIEMPRMDGFEVANHVRHNPKIKDTPIIMITSRTGEKHRQKALQIGVNDYMGKPFQEAVLISSIQGLLGSD